jgi:hypothetical protein
MHEDEPHAVRVGQEVMIVLNHTAADTTGPTGAVASSASLGGR